MRIDGAAVAGTGMVRFGAHRHRSGAELARDAGLLALHDAGITLADVDEAFVGYIQPGSMIGVKAMKELGLGDWDEELPGEEPDRPDVGAADDEITTWVDIKDYTAQKYGSLAAHASQGENIFFLQLGLEKFTELMGTETFIRVRDTTNAPLPEKDLFDGLR